MQVVLQTRLNSIGAWPQSRDRSFGDRRVMTSNAARTSIVGLGDPIVDVLVRLSARNFDQLGLQRGGSTSLQQCELDALLEDVEDDGHRAK